MDSLLLRHGGRVTKRKNAQERRTRLLLDVLEAYQRHFGSTTQREDAAADLGMDLGTFRLHLDEARRSGFDIEAAPKPKS
jgi:hypothetical protein